MPTQSSVRLVIGSASFRINPDGSLDVGGSGEFEDFNAAVDFFTKPKTGREWYGFFLINHIQKRFEEGAASTAAKKLFKNSARLANSQNPQFVAWIIDKKLNATASVEAVCALKAKIWDATIDQPRTGREAARVVELLRSGKSVAKINDALAG